MYIKFKYRYIIYALRYHYSLSGLLVSGPNCFGNSLLPHLSNVGLVGICVWHTYAHSKCSQLTPSSLRDWPAVQRCKRSSRSMLCSVYNFSCVQLGVFCFPHIKKMIMSPPSQLLTVAIRIRHKHFSSLMLSDTHKKYFLSRPWSVSVALLFSQRQITYNIRTLLIIAQ